MELASRRLSHLRTEHSRGCTLTPKKLTNCAPPYVSAHARCAGRLRQVRAPVIRQRPQELGRREPPRLVRAQGTRASPPDLFTPPLSAPPRGVLLSPSPKRAYIEHGGALSSARSGGPPSCTPAASAYRSRAAGRPARRAGWSGPLRGRTSSGGRGSRRR